MSRIGRMPISVPAPVSVSIEERLVRVKGPKGELMQPIPDGIRVAQHDGHLVVERASEIKRHKALHGLTRTLINNMVTGVTTGFSKTLEISGVGYRATMAGQRLNLALGFSHPVDVVPPPGITFATEGPTRIIVSGIDKQQVGETAAQIRRLREPEPYKGKGIRYSGEVVRRKAGKAGKVGGKKK
jgi:large subunit ribosomal protein L6